MPLTPQQLAELQRLKQMYAPLVEAQRRKDQADANAQKMNIPLEPQGKAKGGFVNDAHRKWFGNSKVVDKNGNPLVVYHGTFGDFDKFSENKKGMFFAPSGKRSSAYLTHLADYRNGSDFDITGANVMPVHLSIQNPLLLNTKSLRSIAKSLGHTDVEKFVANFEDSNVPERDAVRDYARQLGHDGMIIARDLMPTTEGRGDWGFTKSYVAFHPHQIKSAIGNRGTYDPTNPDITKAKGGKIEVRPTVFDDAASRRNPKIEEAARALLAGNIKQKDYERIVAKEKPVKPYSFIPKPATDEQAMNVLLDRQKQNWRSHESWPAGHRVGLRLDIPAYERHGVWVNSVHDESGQKPAFPTSYGPVSSVRNAEFHGSPHKAARVATGEQTKTPFAKIMGNIEHMNEEQAVKHFQKYMNHPDYRQIGYDPRRHGDFYDRETMQPVTHSEHVVQIGPLVLAKKPKYGKRTVYAKGGKVTHAHHLEIEERPL